MKFSIIKKNKNNTNCVKKKKDLNINRVNSSLSLRVKLIFYITSLITKVYCAFPSCFCLLYIYVQCLYLQYPSQYLEEKTDKLQDIFPKMIYCEPFSFFFGGRMGGRNLSLFCKSATFLKLKYSFCNNLMHQCILQVVDVHPIYRLHEIFNSKF